MRNSNKFLVMMLVCLMALVQIVPVYAGEGSVEWYEMNEENFETVEIIERNDTDIAPYTLYIMDVITSTAKLSSSKLELRADVLCSSKMRSIDVTFYLQKKSGSSWVNVSSGSASTATNVSSTVKQMTVSGLSSGIYRTKAVAFVQDYYGYGETFTGYSGTLSI